MHVGELNQRITFQAQATGVDTLGQRNGAWAPVATDPTVWAKSGNASSRDIAAASAHGGTVDAKWIIRWRADIQAAWRVVWNGGVYAIVGQPAPLAGGTEWLEVRGRLLVGVTP